MTKIIYYTLDNATQRISKALGINFSADTLLAEAEQGRIAIGFRNPDTKATEQLFYFLDFTAIGELRTSINGTKRCSLAYVYFRENDARDANARLCQKKALPKRLNTDDQIYSGNITLNDLIVTPDELNRYLSVEKTQKPSANKKPIKNGQPYYYLDSACEELTKRTGKAFSIPRVFELAEHGAIAIAFSPERPMEDRWFEPETAGQKIFLYLNHEDILEFSPHGKNKDYVKLVTAFKDVKHTLTYNAFASSGNCSSNADDDFDSASTFYCENVTKRELMITREELDRFVIACTPESTTEYCSYHDAGHILFEKASISPRMRGHELTMWASIDYDNLQLYLDKSLTQKTTPKRCASSGIQIEACYFSKQQIEAFNPDSENNSGRWLTFGELTQRWLYLAPKSTEESIRNLIVSVHNRTLQAGQYLLFPLAPEEDLFALNVFLDISDKPQAGLFQLKQVEKFEKHYFKERAKRPPNPEPIGYEAAFQVLNGKFNCSAEEFTIWCKWDTADLQPYKDSELKRSFSMHREKVTSLADCLLGTFFNKAQIERFFPDERYITYRELVHRITAASGYDEARAEQLVATKFDHDRGKEDAPDEISDSNTLGMNWTFGFIGKSPKNAVFQELKVNAFIHNSFPSPPARTCKQIIEPLVENAPPKGRKQAGQRQLILNWLNSNGYTPKHLPKIKNGLPGPKNEAKAYLLKNKPKFFTSGKAFDQSWQQLREMGEISEEQ